MARIGEIVDKVNFYLGKVETGFYSPTDIVKQLNVESLNVYNELHDEFSKTKKISEFLQPFLVHTDVVINTSGQGDKPEDFQHHAGSYLESGVKVDLVETGIWVQRLNHPNKGATAEFPMIRMIGDKIEARPTDIGTIKLDYLKLPSEAVYGFIIQDDVYVYQDSTSSDWEWTHRVVEDRIINRALANFGINIKDGDLVNYSNMEESKE